jgi:hypothetical protein
MIPNVIPTMKTMKAENKEAHGESEGKAE